MSKLRISRLQHARLFRIMQLNYNLFMVKTEDIQKLRELTGAGVVDCKRALTDANGDLENAKKLLHERGAAKVEKRSERETGAGLIFSYVHNERIGVILDLRAETDFVARSEPFRDLAKEITMQIAAMMPENTVALLAQPYIKDESKTVNDIINDVIAIVGENIRVNNFSRIEA